MVALSEHTIEYIITYGSFLCLNHNYLADSAKLDRLSRTGHNIKLIRHHHVTVKLVPLNRTEVQKYGYKPCYSKFDERLRLSRVCTADRVPGIRFRDRP